MPNLWAAHGIGVDGFASMTTAAGIEHLFPDGHIAVSQVIGKEPANSPLPTPALLEAIPARQHTETNSYLALRWYRGAGLLDRRH